MADQKYVMDEFLDQFKERPLTVVAVGKTGKGKSSTLNSLLRLIKTPNPELFEAVGGPESVTDKVCHRQFKPSDFPPCRLVDTIGLFDTKLTKYDKDKLSLEKMSCIDEEHRLVLDQFVDVMTMCKDGIDAFLFVIKATDRATAEEEQAIDVIFRYLGWNMLDYVIFVITGKDVSTDRAFLAWQDRIGGILEKRGYPRERVANRFIFFDNTNPTDGQAYELLSLIRYVSDLNRGHPYTAVAFQIAQAELDKEKARIKAELEKAFQQKVDEKMKPIQERHQNEIINLQHQINQTMLEAQKLQSENVAERQQFNAKLEALRQAQEEEKRRLDRDMKKEMEKLEREKSQAYDRDRIQMQEMINNLRVDIQRNRQENEARMRQANENLAQARAEAERARKKSKKCMIL